jgi:hypothetical protein
MMPMKLIVNVSRKVGERHYSSRGASVGVEVVVDTNVVRDPPRLQRHIAYLFRLAQQSVDQQLRLYGVPTEDDQACEDGRRRDACRRPATARQRRALCAIARRLEIDLAAELRDRFDAESLDDLTRPQASQLIGAWTTPDNSQRNVRRDEPNSRILDEC